MFLTKLRVEKIGRKEGREIWKLTDELKYDFESTEFGTIHITVPIGFNTDFASIPRAPVVWLLFSGEGDEAATIHDYLYRVDSSPWVPKDFADRIFYQAMVDMGVEDMKCKSMYQAVHQFGDSSYHKLKVEDHLI